MPGRWLRRLRYWRHSEERAHLLREEMELHLELKTRDLIEEGLPELEARSAARRQFGNTIWQQEEARGTWIARWLSDLSQDTGFALRAIRKQPGFTAVAMLSAALGIGGCSLVFAIANYALFRPLAVLEPSRLMNVSGVDLRQGRPGRSLTYPDFEDLRQAPSFAGMTAFFSFMPAGISGRGEPERYWGTIATANYFDVIRPRFVLGRGFDAARDDRPGEAPVIVLSYRLWQSRFAADPAIIGQTIEFNRLKVIVVGVTGEHFRGTESLFPSDFWVPFSMLPNLAEVGMGGDRLHDRGSQWLSAAGRLRPDASERGASAELAVIGNRLRSAWPASNRERGFSAERAGQLNPGIRRLVVVFFALLVVVMVLVLCTACANVANLLLARASARRKEIATRMAIGAGRGRLIRQLLTESLLLALGGGMGGCALAGLGTAAISRLQIPLSLPVDFSVSLDYRVILFSTALAVLTGVLFGLAPARRATRFSVAGALKDDPAFGRAKAPGLRALLVVGQVAICTLLLVCSGLFLRSLRAAANIDTGLSHRNVLLMAFDPSLNRYSSSETGRLLNVIVHGAGEVPGVVSATLTSSVPLDMGGTQNAVTPAPGKKPIRVDIYSVAPRFFETFGIRMLAGEDFRAGAPTEDVVIVNQAFRDQAFPGEDVVGRQISYFGRSLKIVGLVGTAKSRTIGEAPHACFYFPIFRELRGNDALTGITLAVRTEGDAAGYSRALQQVIRGIDPTLAVFEVRTLESQIRMALFLPRVAAYLFGLAGLVGLLISTVGVYGVISFSVAQQTKQIGIRMALGARHGQVLGMVLRQGLILSLAGAGIGVAVARVASRITASLLYGVSPTDAWTFITVPILLLVVSAIACLVPARRATTVDPIRALRCDF